ncbi:hypothetical protein KAR91_09255 [Candidatus Pacearchaeota archaeon]|nr:hypothetical protein [Candidatus Pacearchaeota archaeon]
MRLEIGDKVRVVERFSKGPFDTFTEDMEQFCGQTFEITHDWKDGWYELNEEKYNHHWNASWLEKVV